MSDKVVLFAIGLAIGFASFAAVGTMTSLVMHEVQERATAHGSSPAPAGYAQIRSTDPVTR